jgi:purine-binding chemotaxis protein CheW
MSKDKNEYLTFTLGSESYGIDILTVQEIRGYEHVTNIANTPDFLKGVMNLRGIVVPIVDMRIKFNLGDVTYHEMTVVIILNISDRIVGIIVDTVSDVVVLANEEIKPPPKFGTSLDTQFLKGLVTVNDEMFIIVRIEKLMNSHEMGLFDDVVEKNKNSENNTD